MWALSERLIGRPWEKATNKKEVAEMINEINALLTTTPKQARKMAHEMARRHPEHLEELRPICELNSSCDSEVAQVIIGRCVDAVLEKEINRRLS